MWKRIAVFVGVLLFSVWATYGMHGFSHTVALEFGADSGRAELIADAVSAVYAGFVSAPLVIAAGVWCWWTKVKAVLFK